MTMTMNMTLARERQLEWLLGEVLGDVIARPAVRRDTRVRSSGWLAAAIAFLAVGVAIAVAVLREPSTNIVAQDPTPDAPIDWYECHGPAAVDTVPKGVVNLRAFDFDDAACAKLARLTQLERLDLGGMDVDANGVSVMLPITDDGVRSLGTLTKLRWLSLRGCEKLKGDGLQVLEALPGLEHLDLTYTGVESPAIERLPRLPSLRELVLSYCTKFHGRSLAAVATIPGLRRLELAGCTTLEAKDVLPLAKLHELRYLDLQDCQGQFRGQTMSFGGQTEGPPPPKEDGIGVTDEVVAALSALPLDTLLLGGCESLTDGIGRSLAKMTTLRSLDTSRLPKTTGALLPLLPPDLESLDLGQNVQYTSRDLKALPVSQHLRVVGLSCMRGVDDTALATLLSKAKLRTLRLGGSQPGMGGERIALPPMTVTMARCIAQQSALEELDLRFAELTPEVMAALAKLPHLRTLDLTATWVNPQIDPAALIHELAANRSVQQLRLVYCQLTAASLRELAQLPLRELDLYDTKTTNAEVLELAQLWPGCRIHLPNGQWHQQH